MTQVNLTGKAINNFANTTNELPDYFGRSIWTAMPEYKKIRAPGELVAKRYKDILNTIKEVNGTVYIQPHCIHVTYHNGNFTIQRDLLTDTFLIPLLKN